MNYFLLILLSLAPLAGFAEEDNEILNWGMFQTPKSLELEKNAIVLSSLLEQVPSFQYEEAKKAGYTDKEIIAFLSAKKSPSSIDAFDYVEVPWDKKVEHLSEEYPIPFWSIIVVITILLAWVLIKCIWKMIKLVLYQTVYTIAKAVKDASGKNT